MKIEKYMKDFADEFCEILDGVMDHQSKKYWIDHFQSRADSKSRAFNKFFNEEDLIENLLLLFRNGKIEDLKINICPDGKISVYFKPLRVIEHITLNDNYLKGICFE